MTVDLGERAKVRVNGVELSVFDSGEGRPVVLLHGFPDDAFVWRNQVRPLVNAGFRVVVPDMRGVGGSEKPSDVWAYGLQLLLQDVLGLIDVLGLESPDIVGHDFGCAPAWGLAAWFPERVRRVVVMSVGHGAELIGNSVEQYRRSWYMLLFQFEGIAEEALARDDWKLLRTLGDIPLPDLERAIERYSEPGALTAALNYYRANLPPPVFFGPNPYADLDPITVPVMGLFGEGDPYLVEDQMKDSGRHVAAEWRYERLDGAGHYLQITAAERVNELLVEFLGSA